MHVGEVGVLGGVVNCGAALSLPREGLLIGSLLLIVESLMGWIGEALAVTQGFILVASSCEGAADA